MNTGAGYVFTLVRWYEWWFSKIQPLFLFIYIQTYYHLHDPDYSPAAVYITAAALLFSVCTMAAYGYLVNDYFDRKVDYQVGKLRPLANFSRARAHSLFILIIVFGFLPLLLIEYRKPLVILLALNYLAATFYSAPPLRLKEREILGVAVSSLAQRAIPTLFISLGFAGSTAFWSTVDLKLMITATLWTFMIGVRWIILHQLFDESNDQLSGVRTFVTTYGSKNAILLKTYFVIPLELILFCLTLLMICSRVPLLVGVIAGYLLILVIRFKWRKGRLALQKALPLSSHPLDNFYEVWLPLGFAIILTLNTPSYLGFVILHITLFNHNLASLVPRMKKS